jgi:uncharacterized protein (TIGR03437 family)
MRRLAIIAAVIVSILGVGAAPRWRASGSAAMSGANARPDAMGDVVQANCQYLITPAQQSFAASGGNGGFSILAASDCAWTGVSNASWVTITSSASGSGVGRINYTVAANTAATQRSGTIAVAGQTYTITQAGVSGGDCVVTPISIGQTVNGELATSDCRSPLRIKDGARPFADRYSFNAAGGQPVIISLKSVSFDTYLYLLRPDGSVFTQNDDSVSEGSGIPAGAGFLTFPSSGTFTIEVTAFSASALGAYTLGLTSPAGGCSYALNTASQSFAANGGAGSVSVTTQASCAWGVGSNNAWIAVAPGAPGPGPGAVSYLVAANNGSNSRVGALTVAGLSLTINQAGVGGANCPTISGVNPPSGAIGSNVTIIGANFTGVTAVKFANNLAASFTVNSDSQITATVPNGAASGPITISKPNCSDAQTASFTIAGVLTSVSSASFLGQSLASESIVAAFGANLATSVQVATTVPLPTTLAGTTVRVRDSAGAERLAPLFFVAPAQVNYLIPAGTAAGAATITITSGSGAVSIGAVQIANVAPGFFTANASGQGVASAIAIRVRQDGSQSSEPVAQFDPAQNRFVALPIDLGPPTDQVFLVAFGTGMRNVSSPPAAALTIGGVNTEAIYVGAQGDFVGLDQVNTLLPRSLIGRGEVDVRLTLDGKPANTVRISIK